MSTVKSYNEYVNDVNEEAEGASYKVKLEELSKDAQEILNMIKDEDDLDAWVQDKITIAHHNMEAIKGYMKTGNKPKDGPVTPTFK